MASQLIRLGDGTLVEVEAEENDVQAVSGGFAKRVDATFDAIKPVLLKTCHSIVSSVRELDQEVTLEHTEIELGLSFESEGNIYVARARMGANILVRMTIKHKE